MGEVNVTLELGDLERTRFESVDAMVDTGSTYTVVPRPVLQRLGIQPVDREPFVIGDGTVIEYDVGYAFARLEGKEGPTKCVFGDPGSEPLVGVVTLEQFLLAVDPVNQALIPVKGKLMGVRRR